MTTLSGVTPALTPMPTPKSDLPVDNSAGVPVPVVPAAPVAVPPGTVVPEVPTPEVGVPKLDLTVQPIQKTGNKTFDQIGQLLADKSVSNANEIMNEIADNGELSLTHRAALVEKLGDGIANLVITQLEAEVSTLTETASVERNRVLDYAATKFGEAGKGADVWAAIQDFVKSPESGFSIDDRQAMTTLLDGGGMQAELVIDRIHSQWAQSTGYVQEADLIQGDTYTASQFEPMSKIEYAEQMRVVVQNYGYDSHQAESLRQKRAASLQRGY